MEPETTVRLRVPLLRFRVEEPQEDVDHEVEELEHLEHRAIKRSMERTCES